MDRDTSLKGKILDRFENNIITNDDVPTEVAALFIEERDDDTFGDDDELMGAIENALQASEK